MTLYYVKHMNEYNCINQSILSVQQKHAWIYD